MENLVKKILILLLFTTTLLQAEVTTETNTTSSDQNGFFIRGGFGFANGTAKIRKKDDTSPQVNLSTEAMVGSAVEFVLGYEKFNHKVRFCFNTKIAYENIDFYEIKSTRYMGGIEGFHDIENINLNYGVMIGGGKATFTTAKEDRVITNDLVSFLGLEAYVGADGSIIGDFGYFVKLAYEIKGYDSVNSEVSTGTVRDDLVVYNMNAGVGLSYKF